MKPTVIIADDSTRAREEIRALLQADFDIVAEASTGMEAVTACMNFEPEFLVIDLVLPQLSGIDVIRRLSDLRLENPPKAVVISSIQDEDVVLQAMEVGAMEFLVKPLLGEQLKQVLWDLRVEIQNKALAP